MSPLEKSLWTRPVPAVIGVPITEVDMVKAGDTVIKQDKLLPEEIIARLDRLPKHERVVTIGKLARLEEFKGLAARITAGIKERMRTLCEANNIEDDRILSVKRDAVFITGSPPSKLRFDDGLRFSLKASYTCFVKLGSVEVYCTPPRNGRPGRFDLKGIDDSLAGLHAEHTMALVMDLLGMMERNQMVDAAGTLEQFRVDYVRKALPGGFYREFNANSGYCVISGRNRFVIEEVGEEFSVDEIDVSYNLRNVIMPMARALA